MAGCLDTMARRNKVNPSDNCPNIDEGKWEEKQSVPLERPTTLCLPNAQPVPRPEDVPQATCADPSQCNPEPPTDISNQNLNRKSSKAKRVKSYLKKCKNAALGNNHLNSSTSEDRLTEAQSTTSVAYIQDDSSSTNKRDSKRRSNSCNRGEVGTTSWYVTKNVDPCDVSQISVVVVHSLEGQNERSNNVSTTSTNVELPNVDSRKHSEVSEVNVNCSSTPSTENKDGVKEESVVGQSVDQEGAGEVIDSRTEGGTTLIVLGSQTVDQPEHAFDEDDDILCDSLGVLVTVTEEANVSEDEAVIPRTIESKGDVARLVDKHLGPMYPNYSCTKAILVRQARDLLVCTFFGNLSQFEKNFCLPAAQLLRKVHTIAVCESGDAVAPKGWPLSVGTGGVLLHLGELDPTLLRNRDCYLCVRGSPAPSQEVQLALVWKCGSVLSSRTLAMYDTEDFSSLQSPLSLEMTTAEEDVLNLPGLLQSLLVSVERAIERVPLDDLAFPCPNCNEFLIGSAECPLEAEKVTFTKDKCGCVCTCQKVQHQVLKKDTSIQTSPMFEFVGSIPHIDSDEEEQLGEYRRNTESPEFDSTHSITTETMTTLPEEVAVPQSIAELPEKVLMSGIHLPGSHDTKGNAVVVYDTQAVGKASLDAHQVASLLLYYAAIPRADRMTDGFTVLVACGPSEGASLKLLDRALSLVTQKVKIAKVLLWRQTSNYHQRHQRQNDVMEASKVTCHVVTDDVALRHFLSEDQLPVNCGGRFNHDQLEWVEFYKELEPFQSTCHTCGRRLVTIMSDLRAAEGQGQLTRRQLHHQHRSLGRALNDPELQRLKRTGAETLGHLEERAQWLPASEDVRLSVERARKLFAEVDRAASRLEQLSESRRERLRDLARIRALEVESEQVLSWLCQKGEETLRRHTQLATNLPAIKEQEQDFEKFYFISMRHLDKGSDLLEEAGQQCETRPTSSGVGGGLRDLARSLKQHLRGFSERLEDTRERLEDTSRCFYLLDKAYEWALETKKYMSRVKAEEATTSDQTLQVLKQLQQYLMAHPPVSEEHLAEMWALARKLGNDKLLEQSKVAHSRCQETMEQLRSQQSQLLQTRQELVGDEDAASLEGLARLCPRPMSPKGWKGCTGVVTSTPVSGVGRRRSVGSFPYIFKCSHHAAGHSCSCWDPTPDLEESQQECQCSRDRTNNLGNIQEVRESAEDLLDSHGGGEEVNSKSGGCCVCGKCSNVGSNKRHLRRSCTWQYPTENFEDEDASCNGSTLYSMDNSGDNTTEGSDGKSGDDLEEQDGHCNSSKCVPPVPVNSHLHCHPSNLDLHTSLAAPGSKELKTHKTLLLIMREMIQTERDYVKSLEYITENYIPELLREDIPQAMRGQRNVIFGNVEKIYEFHSQYFLQELERCENSPLLVGQCFLRHEKKFYLYALYNKNKPKSDSLMSEYGTTFFKSKQLELGDKMDLASYLLKPVQRMGKYALLLQQLMKAFPEKEGEVSDLKAAEQMVRFQLRHGNDLLAMDSLRDCDVNVKEQGRLLRQNEFLVWQGKGKKCLRHVFLFEDLILFSKARRFPDRKNLDLYIYKNSIKMTDIGLTAKIGDSPTKFEIWFRKRKPNDTFTLQSMSEEIKKVWTEELSKLLWKQALRNREMRLAEMSSMGIGNKPCLDIRPSADQISDRSISIAQLSKTAPRFRNSITVSPGELMRSNKRPHSIISVSSSSSSGGSSTGRSSVSGSGSAYGALINLGFDPADSPRLHHRSTTLHSQCSIESGIIADMSLGSEDTDGSGPHWHVERSNSSVTSMSLDSSMSPTSPMSPSDETKGSLTKHNSDQEELSIKL